MNVTTIVITDPELLAKLAAADGQIDLPRPGRRHGEDGRGRSERHAPPGVKSPISDEEFEEARKQPDSGITLAEFWKRIQSEVRRVNYIVHWTPAALNRLGRGVARGSRPESRSPPPHTDSNEDLAA